MSSKSSQSTIVYAGGAAVLLHLLKRFCALSWWVGSKTAILGLRSVAQPLLGRYMGRNTYILSSAIVLAVSLLFGSASSVLVRLTWVLPGIIAGYALQARGKWLWLVAPIAAVVLFLAHPHGALAWQYASYWLIPMVLYALGYDGYIGRSIAATFVAHAVGSVLWLYATDMSATLWISLIPRIAYERGLLAISLTIGQYLIDGVSAAIHRTNKRPNFSHGTAR